MDWIVFGDDFGSHPSTTQHLALNLPREDRVFWVNSLGMRSPRMRVDDLRRIWTKAVSFVTPSRAASVTDGKNREKLERIIEPKVLPFHRNAVVRRFNRASLGRTLNGGWAKPPAVIASNPVAVHYLPAEVGPVVYLRLDDYARLPGVDGALVRECEGAMIERADVVLATAQKLIPEGGLAGKWSYLAQGVDWSHFSQNLRVAEPSRKTLGFFGLLAEWLDYDLIVDVACALDDWRLMMVGPVRYVDERLDRLQNVTLAGPVPYERLPDYICDWSAAWIPFRVDELTEAVNPLKMRESLAAGLPTLVTPIPEAQRLGTSIRIVSNAHEVVDVLHELELADSMVERRRRSDGVRRDSWIERARTLRETVRKVV